jgi:sec-independent protein translocase protein TatC
MSYQRPIQDKELPLIEHLKELLFRLKRILISLGAFFIIYFAFGITTIKVGSFQIPILYPTLYDSLSVLLVKYFLNHDLPPGLKLITLNPFDPIYSSAIVSFYFALFSSLPIIFREFWAFVAPGLYDHEKKLIKEVLFPAISLFIAGSAFAYFLIIPFMLIFIYRFDLTLGVEPTLSLRSYVNTVMTLMGATGLAFEFPLIMIGLTKAGLVKGKTWLVNWRWGVFGSFIIAWLISPGVTGGLIETTIGIILSTMYIVGALIARSIDRKKVKTTKIMVK